MADYTQEKLIELASRWMPSLKDSRQLQVHTDTSDFFRIEYGDIVMLNGRPYLIRQCAREGRFGLDDDVKHWVKHAVDLENSERCFIKLVFFEKFTTRIGEIEFDCFRSPRKEARILELVQGHKNFMQGFSAMDTRDNAVRVIEVIHGKSLPRLVDEQNMDHHHYFYEYLPDILRHFLESISAIRFLHDHGEKHGDIRRDHIMVDRENGTYRWIDFDFNYRHRENIYGYDLFGLGNILMYLVGKGDTLTSDLKSRNHPAFDKLRHEDVNIVFHNRVANLQKIYPYIPTPLNRVLLHFSRGTNRFYDHTRQLVEDLGACQAKLGY
jgi:serine/threonine protein kinase